MKKVKVTYNIAKETSDKLDTVLFLLRDVKESKTQIVDEALNEYLDKLIIEYNLKEKINNLLK